VKTTPVNTSYGVIYGRNALIIKNHTITFMPFTATIRCSLSLAACIPAVLDVPPVDMTISFTKIKKLCIYKIDDYPYEKYTSSSFDKITDADVEDRYILSTYDYVFDITGEHEIYQKINPS
jgi:hypothetical protein